MDFRFVDFVSKECKSVSIAHFHKLFYSDIYCKIAKIILQHFLIQNMQTIHLFLFILSFFIFDLILYLLLAQFPLSSLLLFPLTTTLNKILNSKTMQYNLNILINKMHNIIHPIDRLTTFKWPYFYLMYKFYHLCYWCWLF